MKVIIDLHGEPDIGIPAGTITISGLDVIKGDEEFVKEDPAAFLLETLDSGEFSVEIIDD